MVGHAANAEMASIVEGEEAEWPAAVISPSKFVAGVVIEQQPDNDLTDESEWNFVEYIPVQGREDGKNDNVVNAMKAGGYTNPAEEAFVPFIVDGVAVRKKVNITGGIFKEWEHMLTSEKSPLGKFLNKIRLYSGSIDGFWNMKLPGFSLSMNEFWTSLGEDNTVISDFISDVVDLFSNMKEDYGGIASSVVNINEKVETYLDNFEKMSINWSNSIQALNKYADYMAKNLYSMNQKFDFALDKFSQPFSNFQEVITSEQSPFEFQKVVDKLDAMFSKNNKMLATLEGKTEFGEFKNAGNNTRTSMQGLIDEVNTSGLAMIEKQKMGKQPPLAQMDIIKPWLQLLPPPHIELDFHVPDIRPWEDEPETGIIEPDWGETEFHEADLPSNAVPPITSPIIDPALRRPILKYPKQAMPDNVRDYYIQHGGGSVINADRNPFNPKSGDHPYSTFPAGTVRKSTGFGPNGEIVNTWIGDILPENPEIGDKWLDTHSGNAFIWTGEEWVLDTSMKRINPIDDDNLVIVGGGGSGVGIDPALIIQPGDSIIKKIVGVGPIVRPMAGIRGQRGLRGPLSYR